MEHTFKPGDRVRAKSTDNVGSDYRGLEGTVVCYWKNRDDRVLVNFDNPPSMSGTTHQGGTWGYDSIELIYVEPTDEEIAELFKLAPP